MSVDTPPSGTTATPTSKAAAAAQKAADHRWLILVFVSIAQLMVVLDSNHTRAHVLAELRAYSPLVTRGSYVVVMDTVVEYMDADALSDRPWGPGDNPLTAVREFLASTDRFVVDDEMEDKLLITVAPSGYLRCVKD